MRTRNLLFTSLFILAVISLLSLLLIGCGSNPSSGGGGSTRATYSYLGFQPAEGEWEWTVGNGIFVGTRESSLTISGVWSPIGYGFSRAIIKASGDELEIPTGEAFFLEMPGVLLIAGISSEAQFIVCPGRSTNPSIENFYSWASIVRDTFDATSEAYGLAKILGSAPYTLTMEAYDLSNGFCSTDEVAGLSFGDGLLSGSGVEIAISPTGLFVGVSEEAYFAGTRRPSSAGVTLECVQKNYSGFLLASDDPDNPGNPYACPIGAEPHLVNKLRGFGWEEDNPTKAITRYPTIEFTSFDPHTGVSGGRWTNFQFPEDCTFEAVVSKVNNKYVIFGVAIEDGGAGSPMNFLLMQR